MSCAAGVCFVLLGACSQTPVAEGPGTPAASRTTPPPASSTTAGSAASAAGPISSTARCADAGAPPGSARRDVGAAYGSPATLWITDFSVGITTGRGTGRAAINSASPLQRVALLVDAQQDGRHQIIVDAGRAAYLYTVSGCTVTPVVGPDGAPFVFDRGHRRDTGDGVGCSDLGHGRRLVVLLQQHEAGRWTVRRTEIDLRGDTATPGASDTVIARSQQDPAWTTAETVSCGDLTADRDGLRAPL
ncbi:hypothetical protein P0W64_11720 [Tsukamurella sp. 8F]|uniref:hypothetical protein n=1 Tax=unclassified Tsukamurella TaxID=2633480 RepID=UPI0023B8D65D|nr:MULTISPECIES: hypothetical protein [unclassified Tsukamurella]MDF0529066.1 hypothetical protein [Tsukamurella sp. 8J]MDF0587440.1 hypothetical protein [Tsukamurella sp. 8F]